VASNASVGQILDVATQVTARIRWLMTYFSSTFTDSNLHMSVASFCS